jgi:prepilin-type N-terminal cleavage/methylation domain-containing protein
MKRGFTLIELMVAITLAGLVASIVFGSLKNAKIEAENIRVNSYVIEYAKALMLYKSGANNFPQVNVNKSYCLGFYSATGSYKENECGLSLNPPTKNDHDLDDAIKKYLPSLPAIDTRILKITGVINPTWLGATYSCIDDDCNQAEIIWYLGGLSKNCARPINTSIFIQENIANGTGFTKCSITLN